jgi:hypothetical protein
MARLDEIAEGLASVLVNSPEPEPLTLDFNSHSLAEMAFLVVAVIAACDRQGRPLAYVCVPEAVASIIERDPDQGATHGVRVVGTGSDPSAVECGRFPEGS